MTKTELMIQTLTEVLNEGETLMYPIFGVRGEGTFQQFGYFAFTETDFIAVYMLGKRVEYTERIPLEIKSVKTKKTKILGQYVIDIIFGKKRAYKITASPKVLMIDTQKENLPLFIEHLESKAKTKFVNLDDISGEKLRRQYFNTYINMQLAFIPVTPIMIIVSEMKKGNFDILGVIGEMSGGLPIILAMYGILIGPFIVLSVLNTFLFGKIVAVLTDETLILENDDISAKDIKEIIYHPGMIGRRKISPSYTTLLIGEQSINVLRFPFFGVIKTKKLNPNIKIRFDKSMWFLIFAPSVIAVFLALIMP